MLDAALAYINNHLEESITLDDLARVTGYSPFYLHRKLKKELNEPVGNFILKQKIQAAGYLLSFTDLPISNVRLLVGYENDSAFSRVFKKVKGTTPREFRRDHAMKELSGDIKKYISLKCELVKLTEQQALVFPCVGNYFSSQIFNVWEKAATFISENKQTFDEFHYYGVFHDCPNINVNSIYRYDAALVSKEPRKFSVSKNFISTLPGGKFARYKFSCPVAELEPVSKLINEHLFNEMGLQHRESVSYFKFNVLPAPLNLNSLFIEWYLPVH